MKNEKGYALITVLLILLIIISIIGVLYMTVFNNRVQFSQTEHRVQAADIAEMGYSFYKDSLEIQTENSKASFVYDKNDRTRTYEEQLVDYICYNLVSLPLANKYVIQNNSSYYYTVEPFISNPCTGSGLEIRVPFKITGYSNETKSTIEDEIIISFEASPPPVTPDPDAEIINGDLIINKDQQTYINSIYVHGKISLESTDAELIVHGDLMVDGTVYMKNQSKIHIDGNLIMNGAIFEMDTASEITVGQDAYFKSGFIMQPQTKIIVNGDAYFESPIDPGDLKNNSSICITGTSYLLENGTWSFYHDNQVFDQSCKKPS